MNKEWQNVKRIDEEEMIFGVNNLLEFNSEPLCDH